MNEAFEVQGGARLSGDISPKGAKNEALQVLCAPLLTSEKVTVGNVPDIVDVRMLIDLIRGLGVRVERVAHDTYEFEAKDIDVKYLYSEEFLVKARKIRGSVMLIGPLLARFGKAYIPKPGGDKIGRRRLDTHFLGFEMLGAKFVYDDDLSVFSIEAAKDRKSVV